MNWEQLFSDHAIDYVSRGPNTKRGEISIACPLCGDDPSTHLGISLTSENWGCLRNQTHRGKSPLKLIQALLGCTTTQARLIVAQYGAADPEALALFNAAPEPLMATEGPAYLPPECREIKNHGNTYKFWRYLKGRGFHDPEHLCAVYGLECCLTGRWKDRLIIPFFENMKLVGWQGRALGRDVKAPRYITSHEAVKKTIFNYDHINSGGEILFICEGPFDAIKLDYYGQIRGARATCTFGVSLTPEQIGLLNQVGKKFKKVVLLFDTDAAALDATFNLIDWLAPCHPIIGELPAGVKDPAECSELQIRELILCMK